MSVESIYIGEDHNVEWEGARDLNAGTYLNSATVTYELKDSDGDVLDSGTLDYVASSNGDYLGVIQSTVTDDLAENTVNNPFYYVEVTLSQGNYNGFRRLRFKARYREGY